MNTTLHNPRDLYGNHARMAEVAEALGGLHTAESDDFAQLLPAAFVVVGVAALSVNDHRQMVDLRDFLELLGKRAAECVENADLQLFPRGLRKVVPGA